MYHMSQRIKSAGNNASRDLGRTSQLIPRVVWRDATWREIWIHRLCKAHVMNAAWTASNEAAVSDVNFLAALRSPKLVAHMRQTTPTERPTCLH